MADYLVYWKLFWDDVDDLSQIGGDWASESKAFYSRVKKGDRIWVVISGGGAAPAEWRLLQRLVVERRSMKVTKWGKYHMAGKQASGAVYRIEPQPDFAAILRLLSFGGGKRIRVKGRAIGNALQTRGFRRLSEKDADILSAYSDTLPEAVFR